VAASFALAFNFASPHFALRQHSASDAKLEAKQFDDKTRNAANCTQLWQSSLRVAGPAANVVTTTAKGPA
jgi:hypothetical protein